MAQIRLDRLDVIPAFNGSNGITVADESTTSAKEILHLKDECTAKLYAIDSSNRNYQRVLDSLFEKPYIKFYLPQASTLQNYIRS